MKNGELTLNVPVLLNQYLTGFLPRKKAKAFIVRPNAGDLAWLTGQIEAGRHRHRSAALSSGTGRAPCTTGSCRRVRS